MAYTQQAGILAAAARLLSGDAARDLAAAYRTRTHAQSVVMPTAAAGSSSSSGHDGSGTPGERRVLGSHLLAAAAAAEAGTPSAGVPSWLQSGGGAAAAGRPTGAHSMTAKLALLESFDHVTGARPRTRSH